MTVSLRRPVSAFWRAAAAAALVAALAGAAPARAGEQPAGAPLTPEQEEAVKDLIGEYLRENPEVVGDAIRDIMEQRRAERDERRRLNIRAMAEDLKHDPDSPVGGNPDGDVTLVEFFDYQCTYCKGISGDLRQLLDEDENLRFVFKEFPILGEKSVLASRAALAAHMQGKYIPFHFALMRLQGPLNKPAIMRLAEEVGLDTGRLEQDMNSAHVTATIQDNLDLAEALDIRGTPAFIVGDSFIPGVIEIPRLEKLIAEAREPES